MKKSLLKVIALNLAVLLLFSMPFAAFAEGTELPLGDTFFDTENGETDFNGTFTPDANGLYSFYVWEDRLTVSNGDSEIGSIAFGGYEKLYLELTAGVSYDLEMTDDGYAGLGVQITQVNDASKNGTLKEGQNIWRAEELKPYTFSFTPEETAVYKIEDFFRWVKDIVFYNEEEVLNICGTYSQYCVEMEAGKTYFVRANMLTAEEIEEYGEEPFEPWVQELTITKYSYIGENTENLSEGAYAYVPETDGVYTFGEYVYEIFNENHGWQYSESQWFSLKKDRPYLFYISEGETVDISKLGTFTELVLDGQEKPSGYYTFFAEKEMVLISDSYLESVEHWEYEDRGDKIWYHCYEGATYEFRAETAFTIAEDIGFIYEETEAGVEIYGYIGESKTIVVPETINGKPVIYVERLIQNDWTSASYEVILPENIRVGVLNYKENGLAALNIPASVTFDSYISWATNPDLALRVEAGVTDLDIFGTKIGQVNHVLYEGTKTEWDALADGIDALSGTTVHCEDTAGYNVEYSEINGDVYVSCDVCDYSYGCLHENTIEVPWEDPCFSCTEVYCDDCGMWLYDKDFSDGEHLYESTTLIPAGCGTSSVAYKMCEHCGEWENNPAAATGKHTLGDWVTTLKPTYEAAGKKVKICSVCKQEVETQEIAKLTKAAKVFTDVTEKNWYHDAVSYAYSKNLFKGVTATTFGPGKEMTRGMLVTVLWRYAGKPMGATHSFTDVPDGKYYSEAVAWAAANGIVNGVDGHRFNPNGIVTRAQMATILYRYSQSIKVDTAKTTNFDAFPDGADVKNWAKEGMQWAVAEGLITGSKNNGTVYLVPGNGATRAQVATILMRYIENIVEA